MDYAVKQRDWGMFVMTRKNIIAKAKALAK